MGTNRAHRSASQETIESFINKPIGAVTLLVVSISNFLNNEIAATIDQKTPQTSLMFMGIHSAVLTISEVLFREGGGKGYKRFLEEFVDGEIQDQKYSLIASEIHSWRNILVHGWLSLRGHSMEYDYNMTKGFEKREETLYINPKIYLYLYLSAFHKNGRIWKYVKNMKKEELLTAQQIIKQKYIR